ncbi:5057_t:CDS:2 [Funneliformis geosporum]|uniref:3573_t:CDS:1 n=1 Tax=Funneliformis geosporum TaxID=1117311 RepID=A0A9W4WTM2_9GLOM|nr:5057_t:CDS:2 [Funneliformis geosporum]CAI2162711.1 3573_t:CDS:2 [Funneliformis geosporum]
MADGVEIYTKTWKSVINPPVATVIALHGFGEHVNRYNYVFAKFAIKGVEVFGFDQRGFGQTAVRNKNPGHTGGWKVVTEDITSFLIMNRRPGIPQFLFGHSMGGGLSANYASDGPERNNIAGIVLSSPLIELAPKSKIRKPTITLGNVVSKLMPNLVVPINLDENYISRNPDEVEKYKNDPLIRSIGSLRGLGDVIFGVRTISKEKYKNITLPIYICFGTDDAINCCDTARELFRKLPSQDKTWREWPGLYHETASLSSNDNIQISTSSNNSVPSPLALASA